MRLIPATTRAAVHAPCAESNGSSPPADVVASAVARDAVVYFGSDDGNLYAVDAATGRQNWKFTTAGPVPSTPAVAGGAVYFASYDGKFYALDAKSES